MTDRFFEKPILNSPYEYPAEHWELDEQGQPTSRVLPHRRASKYLTPIPKAKKRRAEQRDMVFDEGKGLSTEAQQYDPTPIINELRQRVDAWRALPNPTDWSVTPETARLLQHWRHHEFSGYRPFFCQIEAMETLIWLTEVAPKLGKTAGPAPRRASGERPPGERPSSPPSGRRSASRSSRRWSPTPRLGSPSPRRSTIPALDLAQDLAYALDPVRTASLGQNRPRHGRGGGTIASNPASGG